MLADFNCQLDITWDGLGRESGWPVGMSGMGEGDTFLACHLMWEDPCINCLSRAVIQYHEEKERNTKKKKLTLAYDSSRLESLVAK